MSDKPVGEKPVEILARLKAFLEEQIDDLEGKVIELKDFLRAIDFFLVKTSLKTADELSTAGERKIGVRKIIDENGKVLGDLEVDDRKIIFKPADKISVNVKSRPFQSFFIPKVLEKYREDDKLLVKQNEIGVKEGLNYIIQEDNSIIQRIVIENYREPARLKEIERTLKWAVMKALS